MGFAIVLCAGHGLGLGLGLVVSATAEQLTPIKLFGFREGNVVGNVNAQGAAWWVGILVGHGPHIKEVVFIWVCGNRSSKFRVLSRSEDCLFVVSAFQDLLAHFIWASHPGSSFAFSNSVGIIFSLGVRHKADTDNSIRSNTCVADSDDRFVNNVVVEE